MAASHTIHWPAAPSTPHPHPHSSARPQEQPPNKPSPPSKKETASSSIFLYLKSRFTRAHKKSDSLQRSPIIPQLRALQKNRLSPASELFSRTSPISGVTSPKFAC